MGTSDEEDVTCCNKFGLLYQMLGNESRELLDDDRSQDYNLQGLTIETCEEFDTTEASTYSEKVLVEVPSSNTSVVDMCEDGSTHDVSDFVVSSCNVPFLGHEEF